MLRHNILCNAYSSLSRASQIHSAHVQLWRHIRVSHKGYKVKIGSHEVSSVTEYNDEGSYFLSSYFYEFWASYVVTSCRNVDEFWASYVVTSCRNVDVLG
jgi:hypothetical protein